MTRKKRRSPPTQDLVRQALALQAKIERCKAHYRKLDEIVDLLLGLGYKGSTVDGRRVALVDRFAKKNTVWRAAAVRRFELEAVD